jgi:hypothetical protein
VCDPHVWFDVGLWTHTVGAVEETLSEADPAHAGEYRRRAEAYREELEALDRYVRAAAARVPPERRVLVTAHDAFGYFGRAYGFQVRGLQGISTASEAGTADVQALAAFIARERIPAVFVESSIPERTIRGRAGGGGRPRLARAGRRLALLRRHGNAGHPRGDLHGDGPPQHRHHRGRAAGRGHGERRMTDSDDTPAIEVNDLTVAYRRSPCSGTWTCGSPRAR